jgi:predicted nuclease of predicted toxin-antitoxin system
VPVVEPFLADENISPTSVRRLRAAGHDVAAIGEDSPSADDSAVLARAVREGRILLTFDRDHGELIFHRRHPAPPGVVYFRLASDESGQAADWLLSWLRDDRGPLAGWFTTAEPQRTRRRPLP